MAEYRILSGARDLPKFLNMKTVGSGIVASIFGCTGPAMIIINGAANGGLTHSQMISWLFSVYFFSGLMGILFSLKHRIPIAGAYSIAGAVLVSGSLTQFSLSEAVGAYLIANLIIFILGVSGLIEKVIRWIPVPIVMGMIFGVMIHFAIDMVTSVKLSPLIAGAAVLFFILSSRFLKGIPPVLTALIAAFLIAVSLGEVQVPQLESVFVMPELMIPVFNLNAIISISLPLALLVICTENAQAIGVLIAQKYKQPINEIAIWSSGFGFIAALFGAHAINAAGPMTAICGSEDSGPKSGRYAASVVNGFFFILFGIMAGLIVPFVIAIPLVIVTAIAGLSMIGVLLNSVKLAFSADKFQMGAFFALVIGMSDISFFNIGSPFWAIAGSFLISFIMERDHFRTKVSHGQLTQQKKAL
ncbi:benzoate/H(+) symporter BenE family transporter [Bacillus sp. B15-48]|uniref:benzoate/H(+) symporter BenE family transporter n=1 Tax=Bacillus sp. B15-48 TaxID=1548601 RepID=UPI00193F0A29|nr:benzoate/H(+) symporter BenE family transporter [Bacillus sp. B15-48]MBM4763649.1 benzoate transporter [Bacillus sp. B15-48]